MTTEAANAGNMNLSMVNKNVGFASWILGLLLERQWSQADLARNSRISPAQISRILSGERKPGVESCLRLSRAFNLTIDLVCQKAGLIEEVVSLDHQSDELLRLFGRLPESDRIEILMIARYRDERLKKG